MHGCPVLAILQAGTMQSAYPSPTLPSYTCSTYAACSVCFSGQIHHVSLRVFSMVGMLPLARCAVLLLSRGARCHQGQCCQPGSAAAVGDCRQTATQHQAGRLRDHQERAGSQGWCEFTQLKLVDQSVHLLLRFPLCMSLAVIHS